MPIAAWTPSAIYVQHGATASAYFDVSDDEVDGLAGVFGFCGARIYTVTDQYGNATPWATYTTTTSATTPGRFYLNIDTNLYPTTPSSNTDIVI